MLNLMPSLAISPNFRNFGRIFIIEQMKPKANNSAITSILVFYVDTLSAMKSRELIHTAMRSFAHLQKIDCVCIDRILLPDDIAEANAQLGAYTEADLLWFRFSSQSATEQKAFEIAIRKLFRNAILDPVWVFLMPDKYKQRFPSPWG